MFAAVKKQAVMNTSILNGNQSRLLDEIKLLIPQVNDTEVVDILKSTISQIKKCNRVKKTTVPETDVLSQKIQSLIGIVPPFSNEEIESDERLKHILNH